MFIPSLFFNPDLHVLPVLATNSLAVPQIHCLKLREHGLSLFRVDAHRVMLLDELHQLAYAPQNVLWKICSWFCRPHKRHHVVDLNVRQTKNIFYRLYVTVILSQWILKLKILAPESLRPCAVIL